ncbi:hypothetical protein DPMN_065370 [Dreissena polymorpha]|uniref:Uncharacterized protein n=1 Tax=Dreissena polymorpha TaxID=45954 RepID=A0A9D4CDY9_DREPO|nr:hypothetical protein DPMN_065370 [Dreissena polymorpha]
MRFEENAADCMEPYVLGSDIDSLEMSVLFAADNVDPNFVILDGKGTFHGMGIIASITPGTRTNFLIPQKQTSVLNTRNKTKISILEYRLLRHACTEVVFWTGRDFWIMTRVSIFCGKSPSASGRQSRMGRE